MQIWTISQTIDLKISPRQVLDSRPVRVNECHICLIRHHQDLLAFTVIEEKIRDNELMSQTEKQVECDLGYPYTWERSGGTPRAVEEKPR